MYIDDLKLLREERAKLEPISDYDLETKGPWGIFYPCEDSRPSKDSGDASEEE